MVKGIKRLIVGVLFLPTEIVSPEVGAMEIGDISSQKLDLMLVSSRCSDDPLRHGIAKHLEQFPGMFSEGGLKKIELFVKGLEKLSNLALLLREDTRVCERKDVESFKRAILDLAEDYTKLKLIVSPDAHIEEVNVCLQEVVRIFDSGSADLNFKKLSKYQKQFDVFNIIELEISKYLETQYEKLETIKGKTPEAIMNMILTQKLFNEFLSEFKDGDDDFTKKIVLERMAFDLMMRASYETTRNIESKIVISKFPTLIHQYEKQYEVVMQEKLKREREMLEKEEAEEIAAEIRRKEYAERMEKSHTSDNSQSSKSKEKSSWWKKESKTQ